jgi:phage terminase small subunit
VSGACIAHEYWLITMSRTNELDPQERKFVQLYVETNNGTRAAILSGYGRNYNTAAVKASTLLKRVKIKNAVDQLTAEVMQKLDFTPDRIIKRFAHFAAHEPEKIKAADAIAALKELAKIANLYPALQTELSGPNGGPLQTASVNVNHTMDIASLEPEQRDQLRQVLLAIKAKSEQDPDGQ